MGFARAQPVPHISAVDAGCIAIYLSFCLLYDKQQKARGLTVTRNRYDETWHRLLEWTKGQPPSEGLAGQILLSDGFSDFDPSHPLGGKDGGKDAIARKAGVRFAMAAYFPRGQQELSSIREKFINDLAGAKRSTVGGIAFVTNQELRLCEREELKEIGRPLDVELYHLERITAILDKPEMARVREQFLDIEAESAPTIQIGGLGGSAPGAGGGGGGVIGLNAIGGRGGPGGKITELGRLGLAPGAGGGGAGALGNGAVAGDGGGGGDLVSFSLEGEELALVHHFEFQVGKGGVGGGPGEDTIVNLCDKDGRVLRSVAAKGGKSNLASPAPVPSRLPTDEDIQASLRVTAILAAQILHCREGLWTVIDGGWDFWRANTNPFQVQLPLFIELETGAIEQGTVLKLKLVVNNPKGFQVLEQEQLITVGGGLVRKSRVARVLEFSGSDEGVWTVLVFAGKDSIGKVGIEIRTPEAPGKQALIPTL
jgi:hypothetical protein